MGNFNKFKNGHGGDRGFDRHSHGPRQMFQAVCSKCGQNCEVPFKPTGDRPVFCNNCFKSQGQDRPKFTPQNFAGQPRQTQVSAGQSARPPQSHKDGPGYQAQFETLNVKLDKVLAMLAPAKAEKAVKAKKKTKAPAKKSKAKKK